MQQLQLFLLCACFCCAASVKYSVPSEWRVDQDATWLAWPLYEFAPGKSTAPVVLDIMAHITQTDVVYLIVLDNDQKTEARDAINAYNDESANSLRINTNKIIYEFIEHSDFWMRDYLLFAQDPQGELVVIDFDFKEWGYASVSAYFESVVVNDTNIAVKIADALEVPVVKTFLSVEAGGLEFNDAYINKDEIGKRKLILSEAIILQPERNPGLTKQKAHDELLRLFDLDEIIWLPKFRFDSAANKEIAVPQCPVSDNGEKLGDDYCHDPQSEYYVLAAGGGVVEDESTFSGPQLNPESASQRTANGHSGSQYDYALNPITTNGHTDEIVRWIGDDRVLLAEISGNFATNSVEGRTQFRLETMKSILEDKGIEVVRITAPETKVGYFNSGVTWESILDMEFSSGEVVIDGTRIDLEGTAIIDFFGDTEEIPFLAARSYLNFVVTDKYVLMPIYGNDKDQDALAVLRDAFEDSNNPTGRTRKVVQIKNLDNVNFGGGGMHCITQNQPANAVGKRSSEKDSSSSTGNVLYLSFLLLAFCLLI